MSLKSTLKKIGDTVKNVVNNSLRTAGGLVSPASVVKATSSPTTKTTANKTSNFTTWGSGTSNKAPTISNNSNKNSNKNSNQTFSQNDIPLRNDMQANGGAGYNKASSSGVSPESDSSSYINDIAKTFDFSSYDSPSNVNDVYGGGLGVNLPDSYNTNSDSETARANAKALAAAKQKELDLLGKDLEKQDALTEKQTAENNQSSVLQQLFGLRKDMDIQETRRDMEEYYGVRAQQEKVNTLGKELETAIQMKDNQVAQTRDKLASMDFINNQIAQIERNAAPIIDKLSGDYKWEVAVLTQNKELAAQAVTDWTNTINNQIATYKDFLQYNGQLIDRLDQKDRDALNRAYEIADMNAQFQHDELMAKAEYMMDNGISGNPRTTSWETIGQKIGSGTGGKNALTAAQINTTVNQIAGSFDNEQIVKDYNAATSQYQLMKDLGVKGKNPGDDIAFVYAFAKLMDPNSVVREGEYATIQKYAQPYLTKKELDSVRLVKNINFLSADAKQKLLNTSAAKMKVLGTQYKNVASEYQRQVNDAYSGTPRQITSYSQAFDEQPKVEEIKSDIFDSVVSEKSGGYFKNLWNSIIGK